MEEKVKLLKLSKKSWHYRYIKFILGSKAPDTSVMRNLCPYFWILMFCMFFGTFIIAPFKLIYVLFDKAADLVGKYMFDPIIEKMANNIPISKICDCYDGEITKSELGASFNKKYKDLYWSGAMIESWLKDNLKLDIKKEKHRAKFEKMLKKRRLERVKINEELDKVKAERERINELKREAKLKRKARVDNFFDKIYDFFDSFKFDVDFTSLIKWTKRFFSLVLTLIFLGVFVCIEYGAVYGLIALFDVWDWGVVLIGLIVVSCALVAVGIVVQLYKWVEYMKFSYQKENRKIWYVEGLKYLIAYPIVYLIGYPIYYLVLIPIKILFYNVIWKIVFVRLIFRFFRSLGRGLVNSLGIFGEYFGSSYTDYCPGIEWDNED